MNVNIYQGRRVLVTGHTGFKGSWLCTWLVCQGAVVHGYALEPPTRPALFTQLGVREQLASHTVADLRDRAALTECVRCVQPEFIFHLAAQPLVRRSYAAPAETFDVNVMGTVNLLEAVRTVFAKTVHRCSVVCVTTDKCYENNETGRAFVETDPMGGYDPYSASKGACEIAISSYRRSFFSAPDSCVRVASARAGNVIGGGDWAEDRLVPDAMRAFLPLPSRPLVVRNGVATRPWQHVLEPLYGYLLLGAALDARMPNADSAFNFGPDARNVKTVGMLARELARRFPGTSVEDRTDPTAVHEAKFLQLDSSKAKRVLGWMPQFDFTQTLDAVATWYAEVGRNPAVAAEMTRRQIGIFMEKTRHDR